MNLNNTYKDIVSDATLLESTLLALSETWLLEETGLDIKGYASHFNNIGPGKGIAIFYKEDYFSFSKEIKENNFQITKCVSEELEVIAVYRSEKGNLSELKEHLSKLITPHYTTVICGDFNLCSVSQKNNKVTNLLETNGFEQLVMDATHIRGRHIDHFYFKSPGKKIQNPTISTYSPYYSDHDAICSVLLQNRVNQSQQNTMEELQQVLILLKIL